MKARKPSLLSLIDQIDWVMLQPSRGSSGLSSTQVGVSFKHSKKSLATPDKVMVRFGAEVVQRLNWQTGDKIAVFNAPDDLLTFMLVKTEAGSGYKLTRESGSHINNILMKWPYEFRLWSLNKEIVEYECRDTVIVFRVNQKSSTTNEI